MDETTAMPLGRIVAQAPKPAPGAPAGGAGGVVPPAAPAGNAGQAALDAIQKGKQAISDTFTNSLKGLDGVTDVEQLQQGTIFALSEATAAAGKNAAELAATGNQAAATSALNAQQALVRFMQEIQGLFMDIRILPFKLLSAFARGIGLTVIS